jgi:hypothetical protein
MIRNLKTLITAAMALAAFAAIGVSGAHAAEEKFHCSVEPCTLTLDKDGTGTTAHHVFVVKGLSHSGMGSVSLTCDELKGEATSKTKTFTEATFTKLEYLHTPTKCTVAGQEIVTVDMNTCDYKFTSAGGGTANGSIVHVECTQVGDGIEITFEQVTCLLITPTTTLATATNPGVKYHDAVSGGVKHIITVTVSNIALPAAAVHIINTENAFCKAFVGLKTITGVTYTTGNTNITAETDPGGVTADVWFE